jgi:hypothetical protein
MKKLMFIISVLLAFGLAMPILAAKNNATGVQNTGTGQENQSPTSTPRSWKISPLPTGSYLKNQNQIENQNKGEEQQIQIQNQEQENLQTGPGEGSQNRSQTAVEHMSVVAQKVQELLQLKTSGGIGDQVRQIAQAQNQAQTQIQEQINKFEAKGKLARLLFGTDYGAVKNLKAQISQNQLRIKQLEQLKNQLNNQGDQTTIQEAIQALIQENTSLEERITAEEGTKSLFGWLAKFLAR